MTEAKWTIYENQIWFWAMCVVALVASYVFDSEKGATLAMILGVMAL